MEAGDGAGVAVQARQHAEEGRDQHAHPAAHLRRGVGLDAIAAADGETHSENLKNVFKLLNTYMLIKSTTDIFRELCLSGIIQTEVMRVHKKDEALPKNEGAPTNAFALVAMARFRASRYLL